MTAPLPLAVTMMPTRRTHLVSLQQRAIAVLAWLLLTLCPGAAQALVDAAPVWAALERIERLGSSRPVQSDLALLALQAQVKPGSAEHVEVLALRANLNGRLPGKRELLEGFIMELDAWPVPEQRPAARLAAAHIRAQIWRREGNAAQAIKMLEMVDSVAENEASISMRLRSLAMLASLLSDAGEVDAGINTGTMALKLAEQGGVHWRHAEALLGLAFNYMRGQQLERAKQLIAEAERVAALDPDPMLMSMLQNGRGLIYTELGDERTARAAMQLALDYARKAGVPSMLALALANAADSQLRKSDFQKARSLSEEALVLALSSQDLDSEILARQNIGMAKIGLRLVEEGRREVIQAIGLVQQQGQLASASDGWLELAQLLERVGDLGGSVQAYHQYRKLDDQVLREDSRKAVLDAQARFDNERQAKEIDLLNQGNQLKTEQVRAGDLKLKLWAALGGCVVLSGVLMGLAYQRIRKTNRALALSNAALKNQGESDPLTGLANRRHFQSAIKRLADKGKFSGTVFLMDIDHFKRVNDGFGHAAGDSVLVEVARRLRAVVRDEDLVVRWGGEEFLIVVDGRQPAAASLLAQRLLDEIALTPMRHGETAIPVTASIGFASFPLAPYGVALAWERAIDLVDIVMYMAKAHGRNRAYGIISMDAKDAAGLLALASRLEAAWHEGKVNLLALQGRTTAQEMAP